MVCYARPVGRLAALVIVVLLILYRPLGHSLAAAGLIVALTAILAVAAVAAALAVGGVMSVRHRRAAAGGCVTCRFRCQHAMTAPSGRRRLVTVVNRDQRAAPRPAASAAGPAPGAAPVFLAMPAVPRQRPAEPAGPSWPDRPALRAAPAARGVRSRAGAAG